MSSLNSVEKMISGFHVEPSSAADRRTIQAALTAQAGVVRNNSPITTHQPVRTRHLLWRFAAVATLVLTALTGVWQWGLPPDQSTIAWAQRVGSALDTIRVVSCREQHIIVTTDGNRHPSSTWTRFYQSHDAYRRDIYDGDVLREIQWYVPDGDGMIQHSIRYDLQSYHITRHGGNFGNIDPVDRVRQLVNHLTEERMLSQPRTIEQVECVGFAVSADVYGDNPAEWIDEIWIDPQNMLPVVVEQHGRPITDHPDWTLTTQRDQFTYDHAVPSDTFAPFTPDGFIFAHPDELSEPENKQVPSR